MSQFSILNQYRSMWLLVAFDLPTETKKERKLAARFRKNLLEDGFNMFQFSIYIRFCPNRENAEVHKRRVKSVLPSHGKVGIFSITDRQWGMLDLFYKGKIVEKDTGPQQLEMF